MKKDIKISIVVPVYNLQEELPRCLNSILAQSYDNLEVIVVDDGSSVGSRKVICEYSKRDSRIVSLFKENGGVTNARLAGVEIATGDYIGFVDGDDEIESDMYELLINNALKYSADISHCGYQMLFEDGRINYFHNTGELLIHDRDEGITEILTGVRIEPGLCNKLFKRELFHVLLHDEVMDKSIKINEDLLMNYFLFNAAKRSIFQDICKYHYIVRKTSASRQKMNRYKIYDPIKVKRIIYEQCDEKIKQVAESALLNTATYVYCGLVSEKIGRYQKEKVDVRRIIVEHYDARVELVKSTRLLLTGIKWFPHLFSVFYPLYVKYLQKSKYQ